MRFDDMIDTVLAWPLADEGTRDRMRRQLADLLAQDRIAIDPAVRDRARTRLAELGANREAADTTPPRDEQAQPAAGDGQIQQLLGRLAAFHARGPSPAEPDVSAGFAFLIDAEGQFRDAAGTALAARVEPQAHGVDGQALGAWRRRLPIVDARLILADGPYAGAWRISADPGQDDAGRFHGYRGHARTPRIDERAESAAIDDPVLAEVFRVERFDRAVRELRSPLDAVAQAGGAELLPDGTARAAASSVVERSLDLADAIDSFEQALAEVEAEHGSRIDAAAILARLHAALLPLADARGVALSFRIARGLPPVDADPQHVERMMTRLVGAVLALGRRGERMVLRVGLDRHDGRRVALSVTRPGKLAGRDRAVLLDPALGPGVPDAPSLALGFALRLVARLAGESGGTLAILEDRLLLSLPARAERAEAGRHG